MNQESPVSVIIPAFNAQTYIKETIESILAQEYSNIEIIVVDDGSTDNTCEIVLEFGDSVRYIHQKNSGSCAAPRNHGLAQCHGRYISFMDADDLMLPNRVSQQVDFLERHQDVGLVFSDYLNFDQSGPHLGTHFSTCPQLSALLAGRDEIVINNACTYLVEENFGIASSFMIRREMTELVPGFDTSLRAAEDFHFYYRIARHTKTGVINSNGMMRRMHGDNMSSEQVRMLSNQISCFIELRDTEPDPHARQLLNAFVSSCWGDFARYEANHGNYSHALRYQYNALTNSPGVLVLLQTLYGIVRSFAIALRLFRPDKN